MDKAQLHSDDIRPVRGELPGDQPPQTARMKWINFGGEVVELGVTEGGENGALEAFQRQHRAKG